MTGRRVLARAVAGFALAVAPACGGVAPQPHAAVGRSAPAFSTFDLEGRPVALADQRGKVVLVNFWASWCTPCRQEFPVLQEAERQGAAVLGVVFQDTRANARSFMQARQASWPGLIDPKGQIARAYDVHQKPGIPVTWVIDAKGVARARHFGALTTATASQLLADAQR